MRDGPHMPFARRHRGFTLVELIVVIVILGILAAVALPKFIDLSDEARTSAIEGIAKSAGSAMVVNYGGCSATGHSTAGANAAKCRTVQFCDDVGNLLQAPLNASQYTVAHTSLGTVNGVTGSCTVTQVDSGKTAQFSGIASGNP